MIFKDILLLGYAREGSTRVKNKMCRPFGDTTLFDIYMQKFEDIGRTNYIFHDITMALSKSDKILWTKSKDYDVTISKRSKYSVSSSITNDCSKVYGYLKDFDEEYVMWVNGCFPFLKIDTIKEVASFFSLMNLNGLHCVKKIHNWIWDADTKLLIDGRNEGKMSTVNFVPYYESVHCFHIYKREYLLKNNCYWSFTKDDPFLYEVTDDVEFMDIDTQAEFDRCEYIYRMKNE